LPKVIDIFEGSKLPYFNKGKARHILQIMNQPEYIKNHLEASVPKPDLKEEIRKAQEYNQHQRELQELQQL